MYNLIIIILTTIGVACLLAIIFGFVVIGRVSRCTHCMCRGKGNNNNNNNNNNNSSNVNNEEARTNNFSSSNTIISYFDRRDMLSNENSLPKIMKPVSQPDLIDPIISKNDESIIYSTTSITDTSETKTLSKLCNSGVLTFDILDNVSPYAAISIDDIKSPNFKVLPNIIFEDMNEDSSADCDVNEEAIEAGCAATTSFNNYHQQEETNNFTNNFNKSQIISESTSNISEANKESSSDKNTLPSSDFDANFMKNLSHNAFSSTNTIANTTTINSNSTFYSLRIDKPIIKPNLKMNSYRHQDIGKQSR